MKRDIIETLILLLIFTLLCRQCINEFNVPPKEYILPESRLNLINDMCVNANDKSACDYLDEINGINE